MDLFMNYDEILCRRIQEVKPSGIRRFFDILEEMKDAISLGVGEPDFVTPWHIRDAGIYSLEKGFTKYTSNAGMAELRREIAAYLNRRFGPHGFQKLMASRRHPRRIVHRRAVGRLLRFRRTVKP